MLAHSGDGNSVEIEPGMGHSLMEWLALVARPPGKLFTPSEVVKGKEEEEQEKQRNEGEEVDKLEGIHSPALFSRRLRLNLLNHT